MFLRRKRKLENTKSLVVRTYGLDEQDLRKRLKDISEPQVHVQFLSHPKGVDLTIVVEGEGEKILNQMLEALESQVRKRLGDHVFGTNDDKMEQVVGRELSKRRMSLAVAESCTGGLICHWLTNVPGSSGYFKQGVIAYSNEAKLTLLRLKEDILKKYGAVSKETVEAMATAVREVSKTNLGLAVTGISGPTGGTAEKPVGLTYMAVYDGIRIVTEEHHFKGGRELIKVQAAQAALDLLRRNIK